jgi:hypothetical protein
MKGDWYSAKQLAGLPEMPRTKSGVIRKAKEERWLSHDIPCPGGKRREYHISSLPEATRGALLTPDLSAPAPSPEELSAFLESRKLRISPAQLADPEWQKKLACYRAFHSCPAYQGREKLISSLASTYHVSSPTIRRWVDAVEGLQVRRAPRVVICGEPIEIPRTNSFSREASAYGLAWYANNMSAGVKAAYRQMYRVAKEKGWECSDDYTGFWRMVKKLPPSVLTRIKKGPIGSELHCVPKIVRQWTAVPVQSVLCGDQKIFDYVVKDDVTGELIIANGYLWMDCASRNINGAWVELGHYNSFTVGNALREPSATASGRDLHGLGQARAEQACRPHPQGAFRSCADGRLRRLGSQIRRSLP